MKNFKYIFAGFLLFVTFSCDAVFTSHPIGDTPVKLEIKDWEGTWLHKEGTIVTKILDSEKGILNVSWIEEKEGKMKYVMSEVYIREMGDRLYWNREEKHQSEEGARSQEIRYLWGKLQKNGRQIIVWEPDINRFKQLVTNGELPGKLGGFEHASVYVDTLNLEQLEMFSNETEGKLYNGEKPVALLQILQ